MGGTVAGKGTGKTPGPEEQAVGLGKFKGGITENSLRQEQGQAPRTEY